MVEARGRFRRFGRLAMVFTAALALGGGRAAGAQQVNMKVLYRFDFGDDYQQVAPGYQPVSRVYRSARFLWVGPVNDDERADNPDPLLRDFETGNRGEFRMGLDNGEYRITVIMSDSAQAHGPFTIYVQDEAAASDIRLAPGQVVRRTIAARVTDGMLRLRFEAAPKQSFVVNGLIVEGAPGKGSRRMFPNAPPETLPSREEVARGSPDVRQALRRYCDWLLAHRLENGFLGDYEPGAHTVSYYWYSSAYPIRTLLAGYEIFGEGKYLEAVTQILDKLVEEQLPNGAFAQTYRNKPTPQLSKEELDNILQHQWMNMADVGSIATALAVSCHYVSGARRERYLGAIRRYCDEWASRWQLPSGAFTNGMESGEAQTQPYGVATGTEAAAFAALYAVTQEPRYLEVARKAAEFLLDAWRPDGQVLCHPHRSTNGGKEYIQPVTQFGDMFYYSDGLLFVYAHERDPGVRAKMQQVYREYVHGAKGLLQVMGNAPWFPLQDAWDNSKTAGIPLAFLALCGMERDAPAERALDLMRRFLSTPEFAQRIGVMLDDPDLPWGGHSLQSWSGCAVAATGFGGMSLAEMVRPGVIFLAQTPQAATPVKRSRR
jgi:hypothetical protein